MSPCRLSFCGLILILTVAAPLQAQDVLQWETDLARAQQTAAQTNRLVLLHFWGSWCQPCMRMEREVFSKPGLGTALSPYYVPCKIQVEQGMNEALVKQFGVDVFPSDLVITPQGQIVHRSKGFQSAERYVGMLQQTAQTALAQARPVAAGATASQPPTAAPVPASPPAAVAPPSTPIAPSAAATSPTDDRYAYYYRDHAPTTTTTPVPTPVPVTTPTPAAPAIAAIPTAQPPAISPATSPAAAPASVAAAPAANDRYADYRQAAAVVPTPTPTPAVTTPSPIPPSMPPSMPAFAATPATPQPAAPSGAATPATAANAVPPAVAPAIVAQTEQPPPAAKTESSPAPAASAAPVANVASTTPPAAPTPPVGVGFQLPPGCPPLALDGYCPVSVTDKMVWKKGDVKFGAIHRGRTYLFATDEEQKKFLADPDRYSPVMSGNDPVVVLEKGENVAGKREFGLMCEKRMFLFSSKESYDKFCSDSKRYSTQTFQAMQQAGDGVIRR